MDGLSRAKMDILEFLWRVNRQAKLGEIASGIGLKARSTNMHLINLRRSGYVTTTGDGSYMLTDIGREILGLPKINRELAEKILGEVSGEMAFHFYIDIDKPLMISSNSLIDFCEKIRHVELKSIEFHLTRGDFEAWISALGDIDLARRIKVIRESNLRGEDLREEIYKTIKLRCDEVARIASGLST